MGLIVNYHHHIYPDFSLVCRLQKELHLQNLRVRVEKEGDLTISFCGSQELDENNMLCEMDVELPPPKNDPALAADVSELNYFIVRAAWVRKVMFKKIFRYLLLQMILM